MNNGTKPIRWLKGESPTELRRDPFLAEQILRGAPDYIFREAERREDTWQFLNGVRDLPPACYDFFRAAESILPAMRKAGNMLWGGASLHSELSEQLTRQSDQPRERTARKMLRLLDTHGQGSELPQHSTFTKWRSEEHAERIKQHRAKETKPRNLRPVTVIPIEARVLIAYWLRWGVLGEPGLCFYSQDALTDLLSLVCGSVSKQKVLASGRLVPNDQLRARHKKLRQRLGLMPAYPRKPIVSGIRYLGPDLLQIELVHDRRLWHTLSPRRNLVIDGRRIYPILALK